MIRRNIQESVRQAMADTPVVLLNGARQTGKTTLAQAIAARTGAQYFTLDDAATLALAVGDPAGFIRNLPGPVVLDEIQKAPDLFPAIKLAVDRDRRPGRFLLTGSANVMTLPRLSESLAGRMEVIPLFPFSAGELAGGREGFLPRLFEGTIAKAKPPSAAGRSAGAIGARRLSGSDPAQGRRPPGGVVCLLHFHDPATGRARPGAGGRAARLAEPAQAAGRPRVRLAEPRRRGPRCRPAAHHADPLSGPAGNRVPRPSSAGLVAPIWASVWSRRPSCTWWTPVWPAICIGADAQRLSEDRPLLGRLLETFVVGELRKQVSWTDPRTALYHFRTAAGSEVDVVLEKADGTVAAVEVKASATVAASDFAALKALRDQLGRRFRAGVVLYLGDQVVPFGDKLWLVPLPALVGAVKAPAAPRCGVGDDGGRPSHPPAPGDSGARPPVAGTTLPPCATAGTAAPGTLRRCISRCGIGTSIPASARPFCTWTARSLRTSSQSACRSSRPEG